MLLLIKIDLPKEGVKMLEEENTGFQLMKSA